MVRENSRFQPSNLRFYLQLPHSKPYSHSASKSAVSGRPYSSGNGIVGKMAIVVVGRFPGFSTSLDINSTPVRFWIFIQVFERISVR